MNNDIVNSNNIDKTVDGVTKTIDSMGDYAVKTKLDPLMSFSLICTLMIIIAFGYILWIDIESHMKYFAMILITAMIVAIIKMNGDIHINKQKIENRRKKQN